jgi:hypothetical protein
MEQHYSGSGKKSDASTNKNKKKDCKTKSQLDKKRIKKYNSRTN